MKTTQVTLRNIDKKLKQLIDSGAQKQNKSINTFVVDIIKDSVDYSSADRGNSWRKFSGKVPAGGINSDVLAEFEKLDPSMWES